MMAERGIKVHHFGEFYFRFALGFSARIRITDVRPILSLRAISDLFMPSENNRLIFASCRAAVLGRPCGSPLHRAWLMPALIRSLRILRSNSAKVSWSCLASVQTFKHPGCHLATTQIV
jgi:hypothetical protein